MARSSTNPTARHQGVLEAAQARVASSLKFVDQRSLLALCAAIAVLALATECFDYWRIDVYIDHIESSVVIGAWQYVHNGIALYQLQDGVPRLAAFYGPLAYLAAAIGPVLLGAGIAASKLPSLLAVGATVTIMAVNFVRRGTLAEALPAFLLLVAGLLLFSPASYWVRSDPLETLLVAVAVFFAVSPLAVGIAIGLAVNLKIHAFVYFLPIALETCTDRRWRALCLIAIASILTFLLPFCVPGISLHDYVTGLVQQIGHRGLSFSNTNIRSIMEAIGLLALPVLWPLVADRKLGRDQLYATTALATLVLLIYPSNFPGSGRYHLLPLVPVLAEAVFRLPLHGKLVRAAALPALVAGLHISSLNIQELALQQERDSIAADALDLARASPVQPVQIGFGDLESYGTMQLSRTLLALNGYPALIDAQVLMELQQIGIDGSRRWLPYVTACGVKRWLMPKNETPFIITDHYSDQSKPLFDPDFRAAFSQQYRVVSSSRYFDVWDCVSTEHTPAESTGNNERR